MKLNLDRVHVWCLEQLSPSETFPKEVVWRLSCEKEGPTSGASLIPFMNWVIGCL